MLNNSHNSLIKMTFTKKMEIYIYPFFLGGRFWRKTHFYAIKFLFAQD